MALPKQTVALLEAARGIVREEISDAVLLLTETNLDWDEVRQRLRGCRLLVAAESRKLAKKLREESDLEVIDLEPDPMPVQERLRAALLEAIADERIRPGAHLVVLYNGIAAGEEDKPEHIDSLSLLHLSEHLERLTAHELRKLETQIPLDTLRLVVDLATDIGREGREGQPVGTILVVGDHRKVLSKSQAINFNPFRGYSNAERDLHERQVREQIKEIAQLDGAILISRDAIAIAGCLHLKVDSDRVNVPKGLGSRHRAAAAISQETDAIAVAVSQSSGAVRIYQHGEIVLHIEPLARPQVWQPFRLEMQDADGEPEAGAG